MQLLNVTITNKVAVYSKRGGDIVCGNDDYQIRFNFDAEWDAYSSKTARFSWNGQYKDVDFTGDTVTVPALFNTSVLLVGVYAGDISTTTRARITCVPSVLCGTVVAGAGSGETYYNEAKAAAERAEAAAETAAAEAAVEAAQQAAPEAAREVVGYMLEPCIIIPKIYGSYVDKNGRVQTITTLPTEMTYKIPCAVGEKFEYTGRADYSFAGVTFWQNDVLLSYLQTTEGGGVETLDVTIPEGCNYVQFCSYGTSSVVLNVAKKSPTHYTGKIKDLENALEGVDTELLELAGLEGNENLFIEDDPRNIEDAYINAVGTISQLASRGLIVSHPIKVQGGVTYKYQANYIIVSRDAAYIATCDKYGNCQAMFTADKVIDDGRWVVFTPESDCYVRLTLTPTTFPAMVAPADNYPASYVKGRNIMTGISIPYGNIVGLDEFESDNPLLGKKLSVNGDSICQGAGSTGGYARYIGENNGMAVQNVGISGGTITAETYADDGTTARHWICRTISNMDADADYAIVEGGVNDAGRGEPLGELSYGYNATLNDKTFYGAFESMLKQLVTRFAGKKYGYIAVHKMVDGYLSAPIYSTGNTDYYDAAKKCCEKWGVPFLDLNTSCPPFAYFPSENADLHALRTTYTHNGDGWHPNEEGYKKYYVPKIEAWLKTL